MILIDDIELNEVYMLGLLKKWAQNKPFKTEDKYGGYSVIRPLQIIVTSNFDWREIWPSSRDEIPMSRRFRTMHMTSNYYPVGHPQHEHVPTSLFKY